MQELMDNAMVLPSGYPDITGYPDSYISPTLTPQQVEAMGKAAAGAAVFGGTMLIISLIALVFFIICGWKIFTKAGKPGWAVLVPIYNLYILLQIIGRPTWWMLLYLLCAIPFVGWIVGLVLGVIISLDLAKSFGKSQTFGIIGLWLFSIIGFPILAFGSAKYVGPAHSPEITKTN